MPCFRAPAASGRAPSDQHTCEADRVPFPRASADTAILSPPRFHSAGLTPACSGLAALATDARRYVGSASTVVPLRISSFESRAARSTHPA